MPGPLPKDPKLRQRRNTTATAANLALSPSDVDAPDLPAREIFDDSDEVGEFVEVEWHHRTLSWWATVWASPMAAEYLDADVEGLFLLAELEDDFHRARTSKDRLDLAKEIRLQRKLYGLTPMDRRSLQWEIDRGEEAETRREKRDRQRRTAEAPGIKGALGPDDDPRALLAT